MEDIKKIISVFVKKDPESITENTLINNTVIPGSILIHRMYAAIKKSGYIINDYSNINTYGELISLLNDNTIISSNTLPISSNNDTIESENGLIGVDIESIENLPVTNDFREHEFYISNFSSEEISYCLLKPNPYETFAGLFSAKEALCKINNNLRGKPFNQINIQHNINGKPIFPNHSISISHTNNYSVAVALLFNNTANSPVPARASININENPNLITNEEPQRKLINKISYIALIISLLTALLTIFIFCYCYNRISNH